MSNVTYDDKKKKLANNLSNNNTTNNANNYGSYAYDTYGNKHDVSLVDGKTYLKDGSRIPIGWTVQTNGGIFKLDDSGKGVKVDSHNQIPTYDEKFTNNKYGDKTDEIFDKVYNKESNPDFNYYSKYDTQIQQLLNKLTGNMNSLPNADEIYKTILGYMPDVKLRESMGYDEGKKIATDQIEPEFLLALEKSLKGIDKDALRSGFFGQLPTLDSKQKVAGEMTLQKASAIAQLANMLMSQDKQDAYNEANFDRQGQLDKLNTVLQANQMKNSTSQANNSYLFNLMSSLIGVDNNEFNKELSKYNANLNSRDRDVQTLLNLMGFADGRDNSQFDREMKSKEYNDRRQDVDWEKSFKEKEYIDNRSDANWQKGITEAQITGIFNGKPTMALTQLTHQMGMDKKKMEMAEKELDHSITMNWEKLKNDKVALGQAGARIGLQKEAQSLDRQQFLVNTKRTAFDMTMQELQRTGKANYDDELGWILGEDSLGKPKITEKEIHEMMGSYVKILLGDFEGFYK